MWFKKYWIAFRNQMLTSEKFHQFALKFPLTRPIVRKRQSELFDCVAGFVYSQILLACIKLKLFDLAALKEDGATLAQLCEHTGLDADEAFRLAKGAAALRILEEHSDRFYLGDLGAALSINDGAQAMILHHEAFYKDLSEPVEMLKAGRQETNLSRYWNYARNLAPDTASAQEVAQYSDLMSASQAAVSDEVLAGFDFSGFRKMLDIGGGQGTFARNVAAAYPELEIGVFDLPEVAERGRTIKAAMNETITFHGGSFFSDDLPSGYDLMTLVRILHDHDDEPVRRILRSAFEALEASGTLLIAEPMSTGGGARRIADAYFNFYLYAMGSGRPRAPSELQAMLREVGFVYAERQPTRSPFTASIIIAQK